MINYKQLLLFCMATFFMGCCMITTMQAQCPNSYNITINDHPSCAGSSNGRISATGSTYYYNSSYSWSNGSTGRTLYGLPAGHYSVTITDPTTCTYTATTYVAPSPTGVATNVSFNTCSGLLYANTSWQANHPISYLWSNGSTDQSISNPSPGIYTVSVTDANGCTGEQTKTVIPYNAPLSFTHTATPASCNASDGTVDVTVTGGMPPYTFSWRQNYIQVSTSEDPTNLAVGSAYVYIRDANNCSIYREVNIPGPDVSLQAYHISCGTNNGSIIATTQDMTNPTFAWNTGATSPTINNLSAGTYTVSVTDGACTIVESVTIQNGGTMYGYIVDSTQTGCAPTELYAIVYGGAGSGYTYLWSTGETSDVVAVQPGVNTYSVTITDPNGCTVTDAVTGVASGGLTFSSVVQDATCGNSDGAIDLTISSSVNSILWSPTGATTEDITGIAAGFHIVTVNFGNGCEASDTIAVGEFIEFESVDASCGLSNGSATVHDYGMTNPTFAWSTGASSPTINNLSAGTYTVTVTNGSCVIVESVDILDAGQLVASISPESTCAPDYLTAVPTDGATPYTFLWDDGSTNQSLLGPTPGNSYYVTITDANGCSDSASYTVPNPPAVTATYTVTDATCNNKNGAIDVTVTGGTMPYNYTWSYGNANVEDLIGVFPSQYSVVIEDNNGCQLELNNIVVGGQTNISVSRSITQVNASNTGGAIDITVSGISNPTFLWSNGAITEDINNLSAGRYRVSITDPATGCVFTRNYRLYGPHVANPNIKIAGYVYDVTATGTCQPGLPLAYKMVRLQPLGITRFTNSRGRYEFNVPNPGNYTVEYINTTPLTTTVLCPVGASVTIANAAQGSCYINNFYVTNPPVQDLSIDLWDYSNATPGFGYYTRIEYCNDGNTIMNGTVEYDYNSLLGFESITGSGSTLTLHDIPGHKFYWSFSNLYPSRCRWVDVKFRVPTSTALGTNLQGTAEVFPMTTDATPANNTDIETTTVVGAWDPNDKQVAPYHTGDAWAGGTIYETDEELEYTIRFQNTGTAPAHFVIIRDTLDAHLLPHTIRAIKTRHQADVTIENGHVLVFTFNNIYLPDSSADFDASMGFVKFKINRTAGLPIGTEIENTAAIYFDYNPAVITNTPISIIDRFNSVIDVDNASLNVQTMPNPFEQGLTLKYTLEETSTVTIRVMNSIGQAVYSHVVGAKQAAGVYIEQLSLEQLPSGMYLLQVESNEAMVTQKIVKK